MVMFTSTDYQEFSTDKLDVFLRIFNEMKISARRDLQNLFSICTYVKHRHLALVKDEKDVCGF
jgi:hypothetical protein